MGSNPFEVDVPDFQQALLAGTTAYKSAQEGQKQQLLADARTLASRSASNGDYKTGISGLLGAGDLQGVTALSGLQTHADTVAHQGVEDSRNASNDAFSHGIQTKQLAISQQNADRLNASPEETAAGRAKAAMANGIQPGTPEFKQYVLTGSLPDSATPLKPIPFETIGGTRFMIPKGDGTYKVIDPSTAGASPPAGAAPSAAQPQPVPPGGVPQSAAQTQPPAAAPNSDTVPTTQAAPASTQDLTAVDPKTGRREAWLQAQSPDVQAYIKKIADYEIDPRTTSIKGGHREQVLSAVAQYDPTYDQNSFGSRAKAIKDFATGNQGNAIRSFDVATDHLDTLQKYADALKNGDTRLINQIRQQWQTATGSPLPTNVQAVAPIVGAEVSKAIIGSNNALADREELRKPLNGVGSPEQLSGAIQGYKALMAGQLRGLKKQYEDTTGKKNFLDRLRDNTKLVLGTGEDASPDQPNVTSSGITWSIH